MSHLVIVESPAKGKTIEKYLGKDYKVEASFGHIRDLPEKGMGVDIEGGFIPTYEITADKKKRVQELKKLAKASDSVIIATDDDREGEAIGWHLCEALGLDAATTKRIIFNEITKTALQKAIEGNNTLDMNLVHAQQGRRILDRIVGFQVSPVLWKKVQRGLSAGRVQSVAVKMIVERENEIIAFQAQESWEVSITLENEKKNFVTTLAKIKGKKATLKTAQEALKIFAILGITIEGLSPEKTKQKSLAYHSAFRDTLTLIDSVTKKNLRKPQAPFITSTLQQEASRKLGIGVKQTMMLAQWLYERGFITYMRTDSTNLSQFAKDACRDYITQEYGEKYAEKGGRTFGKKAANAQEAHEAIRPADVTKRAADLAFDDPKQKKLYDLIWKRTVASQMSDAQVELTTYTFAHENNSDYLFESKGEVITFAGFTKLYSEGSDDEDGEENGESQSLPLITKGSKVATNEAQALQKFSRPPARFTEATLVKKLDAEGIGRPSTYAPTIGTIIDRGYVEKVDKKYLAPTDIAFVVTNFLEKNFHDLMSYAFTAQMEKKLDGIASGEVTWQEMLGSFYMDFSKYLQEQDNIERVIEKAGKDCPKCGKELLIRRGKAGKFLGCSGYPECDYTEEVVDEKRDAQMEILRKKYEGKPCEAGGTIVVKVGRFGPFLASSEYPKVKWIGKIKNELEEVLEELLTKNNMMVDEATGEKLVLKNSKRGLFLAAQNYPEVKIAKNIPQKILDEARERIEKNNNEESSE